MIESVVVGLVAIFAAGLGYRFAVRVVQRTPSWVAYALVALLLGVVFGVIPLPT